jgi:hypothetical protein
MPDLQSTPDAGSFEAEAAQVVAEIRELFAAVIESGVGRVRTAQEVSDGFKIQRKLGWQISKVAYGPDPLQAAHHIPTPRGLETWLRAAGAMNVGEDLLGSVREASGRFERLIEVHCEDRDKLGIMLGVVGKSVDARAEARLRRYAFQGNSYIFGVRAKTMLSLTILAPSRRKHYLDVARVQGLLGFVRNRADVQWLIAQTAAYSGAGRAALTPDREPLDPSTAGANQGVPLIGAYCSTPTPPVQRRPGGDGIVFDELLPGPVGQTAELDIVTGEVLRAIAPAHATHDGEVADFGPAVRTPSESLVCDLMVHRDLFGEVERTLRVYSQLFSPVSREKRDELVVSERIASLGAGLGRVHTPDVPRYARLAQDTMSGLGWDPDAFDVYRVHMKYPPVPVSVMFHQPLPPRADRV